tara:strand:+ start:54 stop:251 length:198 start_codon:yes stop_codon:yes gene_type:complete
MSDNQTDLLFDKEAEVFFEELDALRESGEINMWGAPSWLMENFEMEKAEATRIFLLWKESKEKVL